MHVLFVALNFYPDRLGNAPIITELAAGLAERGHRVSVVCALPHHETGAIDPEYRGRLWQRDTVRGVEVLRVWIATGEGMLGKLSNYASFTTISALAAATLGRPDVLLSPSPPITLGLVDALLARLHGVPFVFNLQDLFPDVAVRMGMLRNPDLIRIFQWIEGFTYRRASRIAAISEGMARLVEAKGVPRSKIRVIPNCVDLERIRPRERSALRASLGLEDRFVLGFSGRIGHSQGLDRVLDAAALLAEDPRFALLVIGSGSAKAALEEKARAAGLRDRVVHFLPTQPFEELSDALAASDLHLVPLRRGLSSYSVPSKLLGVMAAGRPALAALDEDSDAAQLVETSGCGWVVPPEDPEALARAVRELSQDGEELAHRGAAGRAHLEQHYPPRSMVTAYEELLEEMVDEAHAQHAGAR